MENWKAAQGTNGKIQISDEGRVRSTLRNPAGTILKATPDQKGYMRISITIDRVKTTHKVHRLVAEHFISKAPVGREQINHKDGNKANNRVNNLEWCSCRENAEHAIKTGLWDNVFKASEKSNESAKRPVVATNGASSIMFDSVNAAERYFNSRHISSVLKGKRERVKGYKFMYADRR